MPDWSLASESIQGDGHSFSSPFYEDSGRFPVLRAALWRWLLPDPAVLNAALNSRRAAVHHWHPQYSNSLAVLIVFCFHRFAENQFLRFSAFWNAKPARNSKNSRCLSVLALRTVVRTPASDQNGSAAGQRMRRMGVPQTAAGLPGAQVDAVLELEESAHAVRVDIIGNRGAAQADGMLKNAAGGPGARRSSSARVRRPAARPGPDAGAEEAFVGIDVAHAGEQGLVEQGGLDGKLPAAKEGGEVIAADGERLGARARERRIAAQVSGTRGGRSGGDRRSGVRDHWPGKARMGVGATGCRGVVTRRRPVMPRWTIHWAPGLGSAVDGARDVEPSCPAHRRCVCRCDGRRE